MRSEHRPCPFCESERLYTDEVFMGDVVIWIVCCQECQAEGPVGLSEAAAWRLWDVGR